MLRQKDAISLQNMLGYLKFLMRYPGFQQNQIFEPSSVYNKNDELVYNEKHTNK